METPDFAHQKHMPTEKKLNPAKLVINLFLFVFVLYFASDVFLLVFAGILLSVFLSSLADWASHILKIKYGWTLALVCIVLVSLIVGGGFWMAPEISKQIDQLTQTIPESVQKLRAQVEHYSWAQPILDQSHPQDLIGNSRRLLTKATGILSGFFGVIANAVIILFIGLYAASEPNLYMQGFLHLIPLRLRERYRKVLEESNETLKWWLIGKIASMSIIGGLTALGLWLMDVPLALILGIIAAILTFIPNIGPLLSAIPAVLLGLVESPAQALSIAALYIVIQTFESYLITPLIQRRTIKIPPGLTLTMQVLMGVLFGAIGIALATPLTAVGIVVTKRLYVEDVLGDRSLQQN